VFLEVACILVAAPLSAGRDMDTPFLRDRLETGDYTYWS